MTTTKNRLQGSSLVFLNLGYVIVGVLLFLMINPFNWWKLTEPSEIAKAYLEAVEKGKFDKAKKYATADTDNALQLLESSYTAQHRTVTILSEEIEGESATVFYTLDHTEKVMEVYMIREGGDWRVEMTKDGIKDRDPYEVVEIEDSYEDFDWEDEVEITDEAPEEYEDEGENVDEVYVEEE
ncbi:MAG: DUF4878 domain-containing protein [Bacteroidia bacterium]|nr:DUF4878 domain-containing protein [Bacteroidia bacterium]